MGECPVVGVLGIRFLIDVFAHHPIVVVIMWMTAFYDLILPISNCHATYLHSLNAIWHNGEIDIETDASGKSVLEHLACNIFY